MHGKWNILNCVYIILFLPHVLAFLGSHTQGIEKKKTQIKTI